MNSPKHCRECGVDATCCEGYLDRAHEMECRAVRARMMEIRQGDDL